MFGVGNIKQNSTNGITYAWSAFCIIYFPKFKAFSTLLFLSVVLLYDSLFYWTSVSNKMKNYSKSHSFSLCVFLPPSFFLPPLPLPIFLPLSLSFFPLPPPLMGHRGCRNEDPPTPTSSAENLELSKTLCKPCMLHLLPGILPVWFLFFLVLST